MKLTKYYNQGAPQGDLEGGKVTPNFGALTTEFYNTTYVAPDTAKKTEEKPIVEEEKPAGEEPLTPPAKTPEEIAAEAKLTETAEANKDKTPEQIIADKKIADDAAAKIESDKNILADAEKKLAEAKSPEEKLAAQKVVDDLKNPPLTIPELEVPAGAGTENLEGEDNWISMAKGRGWEITEDTYDAYLKAEEKHYAEKQKDIETLSWEKVKEKLTPDAQLHLDLLNSGLTLEEITKPTKAIEEFKRLSDAELVREDLTRTEGWTAEMVSTEMERLAKENLVEHEAKKLRVYLDTEEQAIMAQYQGRVKEYREKNEARINQVLQQEATQISEHFNKRSEFMGSPISDKVRNYLMSNYKAGKYDKEMKNPEAIIDFMLYREYGKIAAANLGNKEFERGRNEIAKNLHSVPPIQNGALNKHQRQSNGGNPIGNFGALESEFSLKT